MALRNGMGCPIPKAALPGWMGKSQSNRSPAREAVFGCVWDFAGIIGQRPQEAALRGVAAKKRGKQKDGLRGVDVFSQDSRRKHRGCCRIPAHCTAAGNAGRARAYGISGANLSRGCRRILSIFRRCTNFRRTARTSAAPTATNKAKSTNTAAIF